MCYRQCGISGKVDKIYFSKYLYYFHGQNLYYLNSLHIFKILIKNINFIPNTLYFFKTFTAVCVVCMFIQHIT